MQGHQVNPIDGMDYDLLAGTEGRPLNFGAMLHASAHACLTGLCGDTAQRWLKIARETIRKASFVSDGCESLMLCCSPAARLSPDRILAEAPPIPADHRGCAELASNTLKEALAAYPGTSAKVLLKQRIQRCLPHRKSKKGN